MIKRDGANTSLWQETVEKLEQNASATQNNFDVIVVGGGMTGISTALLLQETGKRCVVLEAHNLGYGTTSGTTAHLNTLLDTPYLTIAKNFDKEVAASVADASEKAISLIARNVDKYKIDCGFERCAAYLFAQDEKQDKELDEIYEAATEAGLNVMIVDDLPVPINFTTAMRAEKQGKFHPLRYLNGIAAAFTSLGGVIHDDCMVTNAKDEKPIEVESTKGNFTATSLIYATHIPPGINLVHLRCAPFRSYAMAVLLNNNDYPTDLAYDMQDPYNYYRSQEIDGITYLIAGGKDHKTGKEENSDQPFMELEADIRKYFDVKEIAFKWSSQYFEPADGIPYIGHLPMHSDNIYVGTGYGGNGMTYSHITAMILCDMISATNDNGIDTNLFKPSRIKPVAGFTTFISHNADAIQNMLGRLFSSSKLEELADLAPGEGKIVKYENEKMGIYKDDNGKVHAINPVCTHMKCEVKWNGSEKSWDCPCHGARFSYTGEVLTGPASKGLEVITID